MSHVFEHHGQRLSVRTDTVESHNVLVLEHRQQLCLPLEVLPGRLVGVLQSLHHTRSVYIYMNTLVSGLTVKVNTLN